MLMFVPEMVAAPSAPKLQVRMALAALFVKATVAVGVSTRLPSVISVAVKTDVPLLTEVTVKVTTPEALEDPEATEIVSVAPRLEASVTVLPETGALVRVNRVSVMVDVEVPLAVTEVSDALSVEWVESGAPAAKVTVAVCAITIPSVVSVAVKMAEPAVVDFTVKETTPVVSEMPDAGNIVSVAPRFDVSVTVLPAARLLLESFKVTVMVAVLIPSLPTVMGMAATVELVAPGIAGDVTLTLSR